MTQIQTTLRQLRLSGLSQTLDVRLQEAAANRLSHAEFLELICQDELHVRQLQLQLERGREHLRVPARRRRLLELREPEALLRPRRR